MKRQIILEVNLRPPRSVAPLRRSTPQQLLDSASVESHVTIAAQDAVVHLDYKTHTTAAQHARMQIGQAIHRYVRP